MYPEFVPQNSSGQQPPMVARVCHDVIHRLLLLCCWSPQPSAAASHADPASPAPLGATALPSAFPRISALLGCSQPELAERLLQKSIGELSASVPPQAPQQRDWLLLSLFALLRNDSSTADAYLRQAERQQRVCSASTAELAQLGLILQLVRCVAHITTRRLVQAELLLDDCESWDGCSPAADRMWLVLQLRTAVALLRSHFRTAWRAWQAAMLIQRGPARPAGVGSGADSASERLWLQTMAHREAAAELN